METLTRTGKNKLACLSEIFLVALQLGLTSFGGPVAHLGYFHAMCVRNKQWLDEELFSDLVALCQFFTGSCQQSAGYRDRYISGRDWQEVFWPGSASPCRRRLRWFSHFMA